MFLCEMTFVNEAFIMKAFENSALSLLTMFVRKLRRTISKKEETRGDGGVMGRRGAS